MGVREVGQSRGELKSSMLWGWQEPEPLPIYSSWESQVSIHCCCRGRSGFQLVSAASWAARNLALGGAGMVFLC